MGITRRFNAAFFSGAATAEGVSSASTVYQVALNGTPFLIDWTADKTFGYQSRYKHETLPIQRQQADNSTSPGEHTLSPDGLWRRAQESWHGGAGQSYFDRELSDPYRYRSSKGIDPWTRWQISLLNDTVKGRTDTNVNHAFAVAGSRLYLASGQSLVYTTDLSAYTTVTGTHASTCAAVASDGFHVYGAWGNGIGRTDTTTSAITTAWNALVASTLGYVKDRLMASGSGANKHILYNVTATGAAPAPLFTPVNDDTTWVGFADGHSCIYAACYSGSRSLIYRIPIKSDGTGLDAPVVAGELPIGETVRSIHGYLGQVVIGSDLGFRFASPINTLGDLSIGSLVRTPAAVRCFDGQDHYIWFGYTNYDSASTGLGRMDLTGVNPGAVPAYASDLMATSQGAVLAVETFLNKRVFAVSGVGIYHEDTANRVASGTIDSGCITYGLPDSKIAVAVDVRHQEMSPTSGSHATWLSADEGTFEQIGAHASGAGGESMNAAQTNGERLEVRHVLTRGSVTTVSPVITRSTLKSTPKVGTILQIQVPLIMAAAIDVNGATIARDPDSDYADLLALRASQRVVTYQEYSKSYSVIVEDVILFPLDADNYGKQLNGTAVLRLKTLDL